MNWTKRLTNGIDSTNQELPTKNHKRASEPKPAIVSFKPYVAGLGIMRHARTAKPQTFVAGEGGSSTTSPPTRSRGESMKPRKLILSRKGFDSATGGCPSPIFPDGTIYSLPIPGGDDEVPINYADLQNGNINLGTVVEGLTRGRHDGESLLGLDPDVRRDAFCRADEWHGLFGQTGASETHLERQGVGTGDVFCFWTLPTCGED